MVFERWDKSAKVSLDRRVLQELSSLRFVDSQRNVVILGPVGVGKTFVASALGHLACCSGFNVRFTRADAPRPGKSELILVTTVHRRDAERR